MTERWLPVVGFEGLYEVSDLGRVRATSRRMGTTGEPLAANIDPQGYRAVGLRRPSHPRVQRRVHRIVAAAFIGPCPPGMEVCHSDGDKLNNQPSNLRYGTRSENIRDQVRHGTHNSNQRRAARAASDG